MTRRRSSGRPPLFRTVDFLKYGLGCLIFSGLFVAPAHAYLDAGTGSLILQGLVAIVAATAAYFSMFGSKVKAFFDRFSRSARGRDEGSR